MIDVAETIWVAGASGVVFEVDADQEYIQGQLKSGLLHEVEAPETESVKAKRGAKAKTEAHGGFEDSAADQGDQES